MILENNFRMKLDNDDYKGRVPAAALADFKAGWACGIVARSL